MSKLLMYCILSVMTIEAMEKSISVKDELNSQLFELLAQDEISAAQVSGLLDQGAELEGRDSAARTPLHWAAWKGHAKAVVMLIERGADIEAKDKNDFTPLHQASGGGHEAVVELLMAHRANNRAVDCLKRTPLMIAIEKNRSLYRERFLVLMI